MQTIILRVLTSRRGALLCTAAVLAFIIGLVISQPLSGAALTGSSFSAGNIINDATFFNKATMTTSEIQLFLNSKVPNCDTNGSKIYSGSTTRAQYGASKGNPAPFVCLRDYSVSVPGINNTAASLCPNSISSGTKSAAQIIYEVSQACGVNPQTLIVLLQKEQGLITDEWPWNNQYRSATGYGCPDTAPCDSQYYGFFNQVYQAALAFKRYQKNPTNYNYRSARNNNVQFNPNASCGSSLVYIENQATANLYIYTPYQPNAAALNNLEGSGDSCSAYGNRNFWRYFNNWFGSTVGGISPETNAVWRLYNPFTGAHTLTASADEANEYLARGWKNDGVVTHTASAAGTAVYRLWNGRTHFFTTSTSEVQAYVAAGWKNDGPVFNSVSSGAPVWRLWNGRSHFITANSGEFTAYINAGWKSDGIAFYQPTNEIYPVWRLYNPYTGGHTLTANASELTTYLTNLWVNDGVAMRGDASGTAVFRLWNGRTHFFTTSTSEVQAYVAAGWKNDGEIYKTSISGTPVRRLWNGKSHFISSHGPEIQNYLANGWRDDGIAYYTNNTVAVRRLYQPDTGAHMSINNIEIFWVKARTGWTDDGVQFYASSSFGSPVYQLYSPVTNSTFYTADQGERSSYASNGWRDDGVAFYSPTQGGSPVYRLYNPFNKTHMLSFSSQEVSTYVNAGWTNDGVVFQGKTAP